MVEGPSSTWRSCIKSQCWERNECVAYCQKYMPLLCSHHHCLHRHKVCKNKAFYPLSKNFPILLPQVPVSFYFNFCL